MEGEMVMADFEFNIDSMALFNKKNAYFSIKNRKVLPKERLNQIFSEDEKAYLAAFALEYLENNGIADPNQMRKWSGKDD